MPQQQQEEELLNNQKDSINLNLCADPLEGFVIVYKINVTIDVKCEIHFNNPNRIHCHKIMGINKFATRKKTMGSKQVPAT